MFEKEIKFISDFSLNKLKSFGSFVTFEKLSATDLHPAIVSYISAELDYMIFRDRKKLLEDSIFDYSGREIADHFNVIAGELKLTKKISFSDIEKLIMQAVSFNINFVVRPKWSLAKLIYNDQDSVSVEELQRMLNYLYYFDYVKNVLTAFISKRKVIQLTLTEFDLILNKIDRELFKSNSEELINNALHSIADFFNIGSIDKNRISLQAVEIFLKEKNLVDHLLKLNQTISNGSRKKYEIEDIKKVLYSTVQLKPDSISSYEAVEPDLEENVSADTVPQDIEVTNSPEETDDAQEQDSNDETEIVTEEKIKSSSVFDEKIDDETDIESLIGDALEDESQDEEIEDQLPIEEEFLNEFMIEDEEYSKSELQNEVVKSEENKIVEDDSEEALVEDLKELMDEEFISEESLTETESVNVDKETNVEDEIREIEKEDYTSEEDELLAFYEQELAAVDEYSPEVLDAGEDLKEETKDSEVVLTDEETREEILDELFEEAQKIDASTKEESPEIIEENLTEPAEPDVTTDEEKGQVEIEKEQTETVEEDTFTKEDFDLSVFEDEEGDEIIDEIFERLSEVPEEGNSSVTETLKIPDEKEDDEPVEKTVVGEMLDDYFDDDSKKEEGIEEKEMLTEEPDNLDDEKSSATVDEKMMGSNGEGVFDTDLASSILEGSSFEDDISSMIDEIDEIIEENAQTFDMPVKGTEIPETQEIEETPLDDKFDFEEKTSINTPTVEEKIQDPIPKAEVPLREKDLFSYLSRKEVKKLVSNVFLGDREDFVTTIEKISECATYKEGTEILKGVFFTYRVSPYSKEGVLLTNAVSNFFRQV
ncbi:MAG: hypothetical protein DRQ13_02935 [Ignavibacteriae bacterium]|nr:MAG: hypothetical protein DRQ13_02935 [Ignavibacteriota bacterium]